MKRLNDLRQQLHTQEINPTDYNKQKTEFFEEVMEALRPVKEALRKNEEALAYLENDFYIDEEKEEGLTERERALIELGSSKDARWEMVDELRDLIGEFYKCDPSLTVTAFSFCFLVFLTQFCNLSFACQGDLKVADGV